MRAISAVPSQHLVGWLCGTVLLNAKAEPCAFVRGEEVFTFTRRHIGLYAHGQFYNSRGGIVGAIDAAPAVSAPRRNRRRRFQIAPRFGFSIPAQRPAMTFRTWAIWDRAIDAASV